MLYADADHLTEYSTLTYSKTYLTGSWLPPHNEFRFLAVFLLFSSIHEANLRRGAEQWISASVRITVIP
jgi:hypothetical protein